MILIHYLIAFYLAVAWYLTMVDETSSEASNKKPLIQALSIFVCYTVGGNIILKMMQNYQSEIEAMNNFYIGTMVILALGSLVLLALAMFNKTNK